MSLAMGLQTIFPVKPKHIYEGENGGQGISITEIFPVRLSQHS